MKIIGHRGARGLAPENTLAGLEKALQHNVDEVEFDLRVTKDNVVILHHDKTLKDPNGQKHRVSQHTYAELKDHKPDLATLEELLSKLDGKTPVCLEVKPRERTKPVIQTLKRQPKTQHLMLGSKSQKILLELHAALPDIEKIVIEPWSGVRAHFRVRQLGARRVSMNKLWLWSGFIHSVSHSGYKLSAYTLNDPAKAKKWAKHGLYGVVTDYPDRFQK